MQIPVSQINATAHSGGYTCNCHEAFIEDEDGNCHCDSGFIPKNQQCVDVNECASNDACAVTEDCENTLGGYRCFCKSGFVRDIDTRECISEGLARVILSCNFTLKVTKQRCTI